MVFNGMRQKVKSIDISEVVHQPELAMKRALYGLLLSLSNQYNVWNLS